MNEQQGDAAIGGALCQHVVHKRELTGRTREAFRAMRAGTHDEQLVGVGRAEQGRVGADLLTRGALQRVDMLLNGGASLRRGVEKALTRLLIGAREERGAHLIFSSK